MKDIIGYQNKHLTGKISNYTAFFEKCGYLLIWISKRNPAPPYLIFRHAMCPQY